MKIVEYDLNFLKYNQTTNTSTGLNIIDFVFNVAKSRRNIEKDNISKRRFLFSKLITNKKGKNIFVHQELM